MQMKDRIVKIITELNINQSQFASELGITPSRITDLQKGRTKSLSAEVITEIYRKFHVNPTWILTGEGEMFIQKSQKEGRKIAFDRPKRIIVEHKVNGEDFLPIPIAGTAQCGPGGIEFAENDRTIAVPVDFVEPRFRKSPLFLLEAVGHSMIPQIYPGDLVLFAQQRLIDGENIYAVWYDGGPMIKKVFLEEDALVLASYNTRHRPLVIGPETEAYLTVYGVAIWNLRRYNLYRGRPKKQKPPADF